LIFLIHHFGGEASLRYPPSLSINDSCSELQKLRVAFHGLELRELFLHVFRRVDEEADVRLHQLIGNCFDAPRGENPALAQRRRGCRATRRWTNLSAPDRDGL